MTQLVHHQITATPQGGYAAVPLSLHWRAHDPLAVRIAIETARFGSPWYVARDVLAAGLFGQLVERDHAMVLVEPVPPMPPAPERLLIVLRAREGLHRLRWPLLVDAAQVLDFVSATYAACPADDEQAAITAALQTYLAQLARTGGDPT